MIDVDIFFVLVEQLEHTLNVAGINENKCKWLDMFLDGPVQTSDVSEYFGLFTL